MSTVTVEFPSVEKRNAVHDAVKGQASVRDEDTTELRCLFRLGQAIGGAENREPARMSNHPLFNEPSPGSEVDNPILTITIEFEDAAQRDACHEFLSDSNDADLQWLADQF